MDHTATHTSRRRLLLLGDGVDGVDDAGEVAEEGEEEADPELVPAPELEEHTQRWQDDGDQDVHAVGRPLRHGCLPSRSALLASVKLDRWTDAVLRPMILPVVLLLLGLDSWMDRILPDFLLPLALVPALAGGRASLYI